MIDCQVKGLYSELELDVNLYPSIHSASTVFSITTSFIVKCRKSWDSDVHRKEQYALFADSLLWFLGVCSLPFAGDNFVRWSGDAHEMSKRQCMYVCCYCCSFTEI